MNSLSSSKLYLEMVAKFEEIYDLAQYPDYTLYDVCIRKHGDALKEMVINFLDKIDSLNSEEEREYLYCLYCFDTEYSNKLNEAFVEYSTMIKSTTDEKLRRGLNEDRRRRLLLGLGYKDKEEQKNLITEYLHLFNKTLFYYF